MMATDRKLILEDWERRIVDLLNEMERADQEGGIFLGEESYAVRLRLVNALARLRFLIDGPRA